ncbi:insulinase family protein [bacterium]|nr:insulinase family protein [bacterium]
MMIRQNNHLLVAGIILVCTMLLLTACKDKPIESFTLDNGLKVITKYIDKPVSAFAIYLKGGVTVNPEDKAGVEIVLLRAMAKASQSYDRKNMEKMKDDLHFTIEQSANFDFAAYTLKAIDQYSLQSLNVFLDTFLKPSLTEEDFEEARQIQMNELLNEERDPILNLFNKIIRDSFAGHPYAVRPEGTIESLQTLTLDDVKDFYDRNWLASRMFVVYVGNKKTSELQPILEKTLGKLPSGSFVMPTIPTLDMVLKNDFRAYELPNMPNFHVRSNFPSISFSQPEYFAANLAGMVLSDLMHTTIRTWNGLAYTPFAMASRTFLVPYGSYIITGCSDVPRTIDLLKECVNYMAEGVGRLEYRDENGQIITAPDQQKPERLIKTPLADVLPQYKNMLITSYFSNLVSSQSQADTLAIAEMHAMGHIDIKQLLGLIENVTPDQIKHIAATTFKNNMFWSYGSSKENIEALADYNPSVAWTK